MAAITVMTFSACGAAPTPLYHQYQESLGLTPFMLTIIFAAYVVSLLAALLTVGSLSDYIGRRPAIMAALDSRRRHSCLGVWRRNHACGRWHTIRLADVGRHDRGRPWLWRCICRCHADRDATGPSA
jgi:hypothetical protein